MSKFLDQLYGTAKGNVCVVTRSETGQPDIPRWFQWPVEKNVMDKYISLRRDEDNYVSVSVFSDKSRTSQDSDALCRVIWADADTCKPDEFKITPSIVVQTSPAHEDTEVCHPRDKSGREHCEGHFHVFWVLDDAYPAEKIQELSRRVAYEHRDQGCDLGWTFTKILRAPNTVNSKWEPPFTIGDAQFSGEIYTPEDFYEAYGEPEITAHGAYDLGNTPELANENQLLVLEHKVEEAGLTDLYLNKVRSDVGQSWSERMYRFQLDLFRYDCTPEEVFSLAWNAQCNKYHPQFAGELTQTGVEIPERRDPEGTLWREIQRTWAEFSQETQPVSLEDFEEERKVEELNLLTDEERILVRDTPTFIDEFVNWCSYRSPGHARDYSHALAWGVLSCTLGDQAFIDSQYGRIPLNLWITIAGDSTRTRKSTVTNFALKVIEGYEDETDKTVHIGSDATAEKLTTVLGTRDKEVSLLTIDEVHGFYKEISSRQYRVGTKEKYTKLYDGSVPVVLRATEGAGNENRADTVFNLWGVGIYNQIVEALTREDFMSGFMYRMTWAISPPVPYTTGSSQFMNNRDEIHTEDRQYRALMDNLLNRWDRYDPNEPLPMRLTDGALKRVNEFVDKLHRYVRDTEEIALDDGIDRLRDSVVKAAALLSFYNGHDSVEPFEMLVAIEQGERWFKAFQKVFRDVSGSEFSRRCDELEAFIQTGKGRMRTESAIYRHFSYRTTEFGELSQSLTKQGRIRHIMKQGKWEAL